MIKTSDRTREMDLREPPISPFDNTGIWVCPVCHKGVLYDKDYYKDVCDVIYGHQSRSHGYRSCSCDSSCYGY